jgi:hypothetical protein
MIAHIAVLAALLAGAAAAVAQDRPSEEELFGGTAGARGEEDRKREEEMFGLPPAAEAAPAPPSPAVGREREDPLRVGGQIYLRAATSALEGQAPADWALSSPEILDVYLDVRPNDRVRGFVLGRMFFDPTTPSEPTGISALFGTPVPANPSALLDQLWVNFDVSRRAFVTAGKQHVKWGVGRFWNPTDWLHAQRRDPLAVLDVRSGATMVKVHVPWEARGWNAYAVALVEDLDRAPRQPTTLSSPPLQPTLGSRLAGTALGGRAEIVLGTVEVGLDALAKDGRRPRFGIDVSAGIWELDVYAGAALRTAPDFLRWREVAPAASIDQRYALDHALGFTPAVVAGGEWSAKYSDEDSVTVGAEWFFDDSGYADPAVYPFLLLGAPALSPTAPGLVPFEQRDSAAFTPFYLGRHYAGAFVMLPSPGRWNDTTFTLSGIGNLSDRSYVVRLDHSMLALTYLRVETYVAGRFGARDGEFRLGITLSPEDLGGFVPAPVSVDPGTFEAGVAVRVSL